MGRYGQLVMGPAGAGKSTYCDVMRKHCENTHRTVHVVNLDPAAQDFLYTPSIADIRELITVDDVMTELQLGPNGALIYCMEFLISNIDWFEDELGRFEDDYLIFDLPGQIELYSHLGVIPQLIKCLQNVGYNLCAVYLIDSHFMSDSGKFIAELSHINVITKMDLLPADSGERSEMYDKYFDADVPQLLADIAIRTPARFHRLNSAIADVIEDYNMVSFLPLNPESEDSITTVLMHVDNAMQYGEDEEPHEPRDYEFDDDIDLIDPETLD